MIPKSTLISGRGPENTWAREIEFLLSQDMIVAGEDYQGNGAKYTRDGNILFELDAEAVAQIVAGNVHPNFELGSHAQKKYDLEFTYWFVKHNWTLPDKYKFVYNYFDRLINKPVPDLLFRYQGKKLNYTVDDKYWTRDNDGNHTLGFDQIKWLHDAIRQDGISRRHQVTTWIEIIDCFTTSPPCLQRIWVRVLVPKSEWHKYPGRIPVEVHIDYRSWDIPRAQPSNLYGLMRMLYRYVFGNHTEGTEILRDEFGEPILDDNGEPTINPENNIEFEVVRLVGFGDACHIYEDSFDTARKVKPVVSGSAKKAFRYL